MDLSSQFEKEWYNRLAPILTSSYMERIFAYVKNRSELKKKIHPSSEDVFKAFRLTPFKDVKVVIIGMEPYGKKYGSGLAYGANDSVVRLPDCLFNIFAEVERSTGIMNINPDESLETWAKQGVLLLNGSLTTEEFSPGFHHTMWQPFTKQVLKILSTSQAGVVYILWGEAKIYLEDIFKSSNFIITGVSPSEKEFIGCEHFIKTNEILTEVAISLDKKPNDFIIKW